MNRTLGRYELVRPLGRGGMAEVYLARRRAPGGVEKRLVVKCIRRERVGDPRFIEMFVQEARLSLALTHKNIVPIFDFGRVDDELFLVMDYVHGADLDALLACRRERGEHLDAVLAAHIALEACDALAYAHQVVHDRDSRTGIVHRDVTPSNVLLSIAGEVKLVDFGVAAVIAELEVGARIRGTPAYMAPEQACAGVVDGRTDLFALGLVLWEALAGRRAYAGADIKTLLCQARAADIPDLPGHVPDELRAIVARATARHPADRYADARAMQVALDGFLVGVRARTGASPPSHRLARMVEQLASERDADVDADRLLADDTGTDLGDQVMMSSPNDQPGKFTVRSMAATVGDESLAGERLDSDADADAAADADADAERPALRGVRSRRWLAPAATIGLAGTVFVVLASWPSSPPAPLVATEKQTIRSIVADAGVMADPRVAGRGRVTPSAAQYRPERNIPGDAANSDAAPSASIVPRIVPGPRGDARARSSRPDPPPGHPANTATGTLKISSTPWARVTVVGHDASCAETPCVLRLPAGRHLVHLVNPVARMQRDVAIVIARDQTLIINTGLTTP